MFRAFKNILSNPEHVKLQRERYGYGAVNGAEDDGVDRATGRPSFRRLDSHAPGERHGRTVHLCFWLLGAGVLLSWNALLCTMPMLAAMVPSPVVRTNLASYLSTVFCLGNLFFLGLAQRTVTKTSPSTRLRWSLILLLVLSILLAFPLLPFVLPALSARDSFVLLPLLIVITLLLALQCSYLQSAVIALAALWGSGEIIAVMSGQGGIAVLVAGAQVTLALVDTATRSTSLGGSSGQEVSPQSSIAAVGLWAMGAAGSMICLAALRYLVDHPQYEIVLEPLARRREEQQQQQQQLDSKTSRRNSSSANNNEMWRIFSQNAPLEIGVAFVFLVSLSIFPPITTTITSSMNPVPRLLMPDVFIPVHFLLYNLGDYLGRTFLPGLALRCNLNKLQIMFFSISRVAFLPVFLVCNIPSRFHSGKAVLPDLAYFSILLFFGLSNGLVSSLCMIYASSPDLNDTVTEDNKDIAGTLANFSLVAGLAMGSLCSFGVKFAVDGNPFV